MKTYEVHEIGRVEQNEVGTRIIVDKQYCPALQALEGFSHLMIVWWFHELDDEQMRNVLTTPQPYKQAPEIMGIFATRSPVRPNPIAITTVEVLSIDQDKGIIELTYIDANDQSPVLDIKPYTPSMDRIETPHVPTWCQDWPNSFEASGEFDWESVFLF